MQLRMLDKNASWCSIYPRFFWQTWLSRGWLWLLLRISGDLTVWHSTSVRNLHRSTSFWQAKWQLLGHWIEAESGCLTSCVWCILSPTAGFHARLKESKAYGGLMLMWNGLTSSMLQKEWLHIDGTCFRWKLMESDWMPLACHAHQPSVHIWHHRTCFVPSGASLSGSMGSVGSIGSASPSTSSTSTSSGPMSRVLS